MIINSKIVIDRPVKYLYNNKLYGSSFKALTTAITDGKIHIDRKYGVTSDIIKPVLFNDPNWVSNIDWTFEPLESWDSLCKERALQLKDELGEIILAFSGGSDSTLILNTFLKHNIPIDEVVMCRGDPYPGFNYSSIGCVNPAFEIDNYAIPYIKQMQNEYKNFNAKISVKNSTEGVFKGRFQKDIFETENVAYTIDATGMAQNYILDQDYLYKGKVIINGAVEPYIHLDKDTNKWYVSWFDTDNLSQQCRDNYVPFFLTPQLLVKQAHLCMKLAKHRGATLATKDIQIEASRTLHYDYSTNPLRKINLKYLGPAKNPFEKLFLRETKSINTLKIYKAKQEKKWRQLFETYYINDKFFNRPVGEFMCGYMIAQEYLEK